MNEKVIAKIKELALAMYEKGGDTFIECYGKEEWEEFFEQVERYNEDPIEYAKSLMKLWHDNNRDWEEAYKFFNTYTGQ